MKKFSSLFLMLAVVGFSFAQPCTKLFISEYVEGSGNNKALEIYNPTFGAVNLSGYQLLLYPNGASTAGTTFNLTGTIAAGGTYVVANSQGTWVLNKKDVTSGVCSFTGNDAIELKAGSTVIDRFGVVGSSAQLDSATDHTLVRIASVQEGTTNWTIGKTQWTVYPKDDSTHLRAHTMTPCSAPVDTVGNFSVNAISLNETSGVYNLGVSLNQTVGASKTATVTLVSMGPGGTAADVSGFTTQTVTFAAGSSTGSVPVTLFNDVLKEGDETFTFKLTNPSAGLKLGSDTVFTLTILDDDSVVVIPGLPFYPIGLITTNDQNGVADSNNVKCLTSGVVYGINFRKTGLGFYINDHTGAIYPFSASKKFGYTPTEGDSVVVQGKVSQYFGFNEFILDTVIVISSGNGLIDPVVLTNKPTETNECKLVRVNGLTYTSGWTNSGSGFTVIANKGATKFYIRIDSLTTAYGTPVPTSPFDVIGLVSQYDTGAPFDFGYDINVRYAADIIRSTGIEEVSSAKVTVYPNPSKDEFTLLVNVDAAEANVKIYDLIGNLVYDEKQSINNNAIHVKSNLTNGFYYGLVDSGKTKVKFKLEVIK